MTVEGQREGGREPSLIRLGKEAGDQRDYRGAIIALGQFEAFHIGHQTVLETAVARARAEGRPALILTVDRAAQKNGSAGRFTSIAQRQRLFAAAGADAMIVLRPDSSSAWVSIDEPLIHELVQRYGVAGLVIGKGWRPMSARSSDGAVAEWAGRSRLSYDEVPTVLHNETPASTAAVRRALQAGDSRLANKLLGRPYAIVGIVQHGDKVGRTIGYRTANLVLGDYFRPRYGIYAVRGRLSGGRVVDGVANLGVRPSFDPPKELLEPHFFEFEGDLYGHNVEVELHTFIRDEAKIDSLVALKAQIDQDCRAARAALRGANRCC